MKKKQLQKSKKKTINKVDFKKVLKDIKEEEKLHDIGRGWTESDH